MSWFHVCSIVDNETDGVYVDPDITDSLPNYQQPVMPPMPGGLSTDQVNVSPDQMNFNVQSLG